MKLTRRKSNTKRGKNRLRTIVSTAILIIAAILYINQEILQSQSEQQHLSPEKLEQESQQNLHQETETGLEFPQMAGDEKLINYEGFTVCYNEKALIPHWVAYQMENYETAKKYDEPTNISLGANIAGFLKVYDAMKAEGVI